MASPTEVKILTVTDNPSAPRELLQMLGENSGAKTLFADTTNAVSRTLETEHIDMIIIQVDVHDLGLLESTSRQAREQEHPIPIMAIIKEEDARSALAAAGCGVEGSVMTTNPRQIKRLALYLVDAVRSRRDARIATKRLEEIEDRYTLLLDSSSEAISYIHEGLHIYANRAYLELFGFENFEDLEGLSMLDLLSPSEEVPDLRKVLKKLAHDDIPEEAMTLNAHRQDGSEFTATVDFSPAQYGGEYCAQMLVREKMNQADPELALELEKLKTRDMVTGLFNRPAFLSHLAGIIEKQDTTAGLAVLLMSLDNHSELQSKIGLGATDLLIREAAELFKKASGEDLTMARLRDNTFAVVLEKGDREQAETLARGIVDHCSGRIIEVKDTSLTVSASVGLSLAGSEATDADTLVGQADSALSEAMHSGGNAFVRYRPRVSGGGDDDDSIWAQRLSHALDNEEIRLVTSPITSMEDDSFLINEVETRLRSEENDEVIMPTVYLPVAARIGMAVRLDLDMLKRLVGALAEKDPGQDEHWLVPLCLDTMNDESSRKFLTDLLDKQRLDPNRVIWGLREPEVREKLRRAQVFIEEFKPRGVRFALCDVGPGAAVEPLLRHLEIDYIRMAPEMIQNLSGDDALRQKLSELVNEADQHQVQMIAPKVEHTGDLATLWQFGITLVQGDFVREESSA